MKAPFETPIRIADGPFGSKTLVAADHELILSTHDATQEELEWIVLCVNSQPNPDNVG